jgi:parallel beta-helix repeat protein
MRRFVSCFLLTLLLVSIFTFALAVGTVRAQGETVYINVDGSVSPSSAPISTVDNVTYTFTGNISDPVYDGIIVERSNIIIDGAGFTVQGVNNTGVDGIGLASVSNVTVMNTNVEDFYWGIDLEDSTNSTIIWNNVTVNQYLGIFLDDSSNTTVSYNNVTANGNVAYLPPNNQPIAEGIGIEIYQSSGNTVQGNEVAANLKYGITVWYSSNNNSITGNNVTANKDEGIYLFSSSNNNAIYHNNFIGNVVQAFVDSTSVGNAWDNGYPSGGNYWSDYNGTDLYNGSYQNLTGSDGIGDTPYVIDANNLDNYPLMAPYVPFDNQTIYINVDGSIDPSGAPILRNGDLYTLTGNITSSSDGIVIERDSIVLDGAGFTVQGNGTGNGIDLSNRSSVTIENTNIENFGYGVYLENSSNVSISGNNATANGWDGIFLDSCLYNTISGNNLNNNDNSGLNVEFSNDSIISGNTMTANKLDGLYIQYSSDNIIIENNASANTPLDGLAILWCSNDTIEENTVTANANIGLMMLWCSGVNLYGNNVSANYYGITISGDGNASHNNIIGGNLLTMNYVGIEITDDNNIVCENTVTNDTEGFELYCLNTMVVGNIFANNSQAVSLAYWVTGNTFYHNSFIDNLNQNYVVSSNIWDDGYPSGGNYWSDYNGTDLYSGPYQNVTGSDGIGDKPYSIAANNTDHYPLMKPIIPPLYNVGITALGPWRTIVGQGVSFNLSAEVNNYGGLGTEIFNVALLISPTTIETQTVTLPMRNSTNIVFTVNTTDLAFGNHTVTMSAVTNFSNNNLTSWIIVSLVGDVTGANGWPDGKVDIRDVHYVAIYYGATPSSSNWNPNADINNDGKIDIRDVHIVAKNYGQHYP